MYIANKLVVAFLAFVIAYFAVMAGDSLGDFFKETSKNADDWSTIATYAAVYTVLVCSYWWYGFKHQVAPQSESPISLMASCAGPVGLTFLFGALARPITDLGPWPWHWYTAWTFVVVIGVVPLVLLVVNAIREIIHLNTRKPDTNVTPLRKTS